MRTSQQDNALRQNNITKRLGVEIGPHVQDEILAHLVIKKVLPSNEIELFPIGRRRLIYLWTSGGCQHFDVLVTDRIVSQSQ